MLKQQNLTLATKLTSAKLALHRVEARLTFAKSTIRQGHENIAKQLVRLSGKRSSSSDSSKSSPFTPKAPSSVPSGHPSDSCKPQEHIDSLLGIGSSQEVISPEKTLVTGELTPPSQSNTENSYPFHHLTPEKTSKECLELEVLRHKVAEGPKLAKRPELPSVAVLNQPMRVSQKHQYIHYNFAEDIKASGTTPAAQSQLGLEPAPLIDFGPAIGVTVDAVSPPTYASESARDFGPGHGSKDSLETSPAAETPNPQQNPESGNFALASRGGLDVSAWNNLPIVSQSENLERELDGKPTTEAVRIGHGTSAWNDFADENGFKAIARGIQPPPPEDRPPPYAISPFTSNNDTQEFSTTPRQSRRSREARHHNQPKDVVFDSPIEQQQARYIHQRVAGHSDLFDPAFFTNGLLYNPPAGALKFCRAVTIDNIPVGIRLAEVLGSITTGPLISAHLLDTRPITQSMTVYLVFLEEDSAITLVKAQSTSPLVFYNRPARVQRVLSSTPPLPPLLHYGIFSEGWTRCVAITNVPKNFTPELCKSIISCPQLKRDWIVDVKMRAKDAAIVIHFETIEAAEWAFQRLRRTDMLEGSTVCFARDPCDGGFAEIEVGLEEKSIAEAEAEASAKERHPENMNKLEEGEWEDCEDSEAVESD